MEKTIKLHSLGYRESKTYLFAAIFVVGNILLPQLCHLVNMGGLIFLPIYFFTLIGAYKFGWRVGLLTALFSPLINSALFGMPHVALLPSILIKSGLLAAAAAYAASKFNKVSILTLAAVVLSYQTVGSLIEWAIIGDFALAIQDFHIGVPGILIQIFAGYYVIKSIKL